MAQDGTDGGDRGQAGTGEGDTNNSQEIPYRGVCRSGLKFSAHLNAGPKSYLGVYMTREEAAKAHDKAALERFGDKAIINFLPDGRLNPARLLPRLSPTKSRRFKGVHVNARGWAAVYCSNGRETWLGSFATEEEAARAYDNHARAEDGAFAIVNYLPNGSINPLRHMNRHRQRWAEVYAQLQGHHQGGGLAAANTNQEEKGEGEEDQQQQEEAKEEEEQEAEGRCKRRRLDDEPIIDLTDDEPLEVTAAPASHLPAQIALPTSLRAAAPEAAAVTGRMAVAAGGEGSPAGFIQPLLLPAQPLPLAYRTAPNSASSSGQTMAPAPFVQAPAPLPVPKAEVVLPASAPPRVSPPAPRLSVSVEATAAVPPSSSAAPSRAGADVKMSLWKAVALLGAEAYLRLVACEEGSEQRESLNRLLDLLEQLRREASGAGLSSSSSSASSSGGSMADLRAFLLTSVCPRYTAEALTGSHLDNVMQMGLCIAKL